MATIKAGTYRFNDVLTAPSDVVYAQVNITLPTIEVDGETDNLNFSEIECYNRGSDGALVVLYDAFIFYIGSNYEPYGFVGWNAFAIEYGIGSYYGQTITIPTDSEVSDEFYAWFTTNAAEVVEDTEETPVATIIYGGSVIASLNEGQTATLKCAGMKMESDVVVEVDDGEGDFPADLYFEGGYAEVNLPNATKIRDYGFYYDKTITNIVMPKVTSIGKDSFGYCSNLAQLSLPSGLTSIGVYAFRDCSQLALTELPSGITQIDNNAFNGCSKLALTELPNGLKTIGTYAFCNCSNLALTELPSRITIIGQNAFMNCTKLAVSTLPSGVTYLNDAVFRGCTSIVSMEIPIGVTNVVGVPFRDCTGLVTVTFRGKPSFNSLSPFSGCTNLTTINVPWAEGAVSGAPWGATNATINYNYTGG